MEVVDCHSVVDAAVLCWTRVAADVSNSMCDSLIQLTGCKPNLSDV